MTLTGTPPPTRVRCAAGPQADAAKLISRTVLLLAAEALSGQARGGEPVREAVVSRARTPERTTPADTQ